MWGFVVVQSSHTPLFKNHFPNKDNTRFNCDVGACFKPKSSFIKYCPSFISHLLISGSNCFNLSIISCDFSKP